MLYDIPEINKLCDNSGKVVKIKKKSAGRFDMKAGGGVGPLLQSSTEGGGAPPSCTVAILGDQSSARRQAPTHMVGPSKEKRMPSSQSNHWQ